MGVAPRTAWRICPICEAGCGLAIDIDEQDRVVRIRGDQDDVMSRGFLCPKGAQLAALDFDPDRLTAPRVRRNGVLVPATWQEAFEAIGQGLGQVIGRTGRGSLGLYLGNAIAHSLSGLMYVRQLAHAIGTRQVFSASSVDSHPKFVSCGWMFGDPYTIAVPDIERTDLLVVIGANPMASNGSLWTVPDFPGRLRELKARGGRLVVIDPRTTATAQAADWHLPIRPGTDALMLCAVVTALRREGLLNPVPGTQGLDALLEATAGFTPEGVAPACGLVASDIVELARLIGRSERACVYGRMGVSTVPFGTLTNSLIDAIAVMTGHIDRPGTLMFPLPALYTQPRHAFATGRWHSRVKGLPEVIGEMPAATLIDELETPGPGQVKALLVVGGNPVLSTPDAARLEAALRSLDFLVCVDPHVTATSRLADVVLPPLRAMERVHYDVFFSGRAVRNHAHFSPPVFAPPPGALDEWEILLTLAALASGDPLPVDTRQRDEAVFDAALARALRDPGARFRVRDAAAVKAAMGEGAGVAGPERLLDLGLRSGPYGDGFGLDPSGLSLAVLRAHPHGVDLGPLKPRLPALLSTASGCIELAHPEILRELERLRAWTHDAPPDTHLLVGRRHLRTNNSTTHNAPRLSRERGRTLCTLQMHPDDAEALGLANGDRAEVSTQAGQVIAPVEVTPLIRRGVVSLPHGFGHDLPGVELRVAQGMPGVNSNLLNSREDVDRPSGNAVLNAIAVRVRPAPPEQRKDLSCQPT